MLVSIIPGLNTADSKRWKNKNPDYNLIEGYNNIFAIGIFLYMETERSSHGIRVAQKLYSKGKQLKATLIRQLIKKTPKPLDHFDKGSMATIGRNKAVVDLKFWKFLWDFCADNLDVYTPTVLVQVSEINW